MTRVLSPQVIGALCAVGAASFFSLNDTAVKFLSGGYPLHQVILFRSLVALTISLLIFIPLGGGLALLRTRNIGAHLFRGVLIVGSNMTFFLALAAMPIANATAIFFVSPLVIALFSILFLGERVGPRRWAAIATGFVGVVIMIRPGTDAFTPVALLPMLAACGYAGMHMMTRKLGRSEGPVTMAFYIQITFLLFSLGFGIAFGDGRFDTGSHASLSFLLRAWVWPEFGDLGVFALAGMGTAFGGLMISQAYRLCEAALVAPIEYTAMPMAILLGVLVFGEWPDATAWVGIALILGAGCYMIMRETRSDIL